MNRLADAADLPSVLALDARLFEADAWSEHAWGEELVATGRRFVVAELGDELVGYAVSMQLGDVVDLQRIGVHPEHRRLGIAGSLLDDLLAHARGADRILLEVSADNRGALAFYAHHGFSKIAVRERYYRDGTDALVLRRVLPSPPQ